MWVLGVLIGAALGFMAGGELRLLEAILGGAAGWMLDRKPKKEQLNELEERRAEAERQPEAELGQPLGARRHRHAPLARMDLLGNSDLQSAKMLFLV
jgi:hypothetical protein